MRINYNDEKNEMQYYDMHGNEIHDGDTVYMDGKERKVYATTEGLLGVDATNPKWIETGRACECEWGIYPFECTDEPELILNRKGVNE